MHPTIQHYGILPGDRIVEPKSTLRIVQHHSIYVGQDDVGRDWIVENKIGHGVRLVTAVEYFNTVFEITRIEKFRGDNYERKLAVQKALDLVGRSYDLINFNCEHFANYIQHGSAHSLQINSAAKVAAGTGLFVLAVAVISALFDDEE